MSASTATPHSAPLFTGRSRLLRLGPVAARVDMRAALITLALVVAALGFAWWNLLTGSSAFGAAEALGAFVGQTDEATSRVILEWRLPRIVFCLLGGAALGIAGAVFQSITRNPLGSPDIIGFGTGAYTGALVVALLGASGMWMTPLGAIIGGTVTGIAIYFLAWKGGVSGMRIILIGIGMTILLDAVNTYLITTMDLQVALTAATWGAGSVSDIAWMHVIPLGLAAALVVPVLIAKQRDLTLMEMGDDPARGLGIRTEGVRLLMVLGAIILVALTTAAAGPIAFVALVAPQLALRLTRSSTVQIIPAAAMGAVLLSVSDLITRLDLLPVQPPVGVVTLSLGGAYLIWLLIGFGRKKAS
ncbi:FecCD family ABC transporter permease [Nesterenkonia flava]|uniref:Iron chelate uptake ABC transporter family permease subunit n=1 Tax=Nesterenkonia flava TaxID=469799 RepID=A0ABU1FTD7_9MICC|nr:iron chelate uptake ABC transporter family permease subunit [Nesterenkonia flava]MDR5711928.1 iron chelate uptake ABC transporter family permease subunit [Nesterenkonia flava]